MPEKSLNPCPDYGPFEDSLNVDKPAGYCAPCEELTQKQVSNPLDDLAHTFPYKTGLGQSGLCDPMQSGNIVNNLAQSPNSNVIYRNTRAIRGCDEAMMDLFRDIVVIDEQGVAHPVPIIWATQERAVAAVVQTNVRKDDSNVVDRVKLPMMAIHSAGFQFNQERYTYHRAINYFNGKDGHPSLTFREKRDRDTIFGLARGIPIDISYELTVWTLYVEDVHQILEQVVTKFSPIAYIRVQGVQWEIGVKLDSIANNIDMEPGDTALRVVKFQFGMTAETYVPQPIFKQKTVLQERIEVANSINEDEIIEILGRFEVNP